jgi:hypothetical protein
MRAHRPRRQAHDRGNRLPSKISPSGHVRRLAPLAFLSPRIIHAIADSTAPARLTVSQALPHSWKDQEQLLGLG